MTPFIGIRANPSVGHTSFENGINSAILRYDGAPHQEPTSTQIPSVIPLNEADLQVSVSSFSFHLYQC